MNGAKPALLTAAVEGITDEAAARKLAMTCGLSVSAVHVSHGKHQLDRRLSGYNAAARYHPWLVLRDLDQDADCAPELLAALLPRQSAQLSLRIPVRSLEAWLLADRLNLARFLSVPDSRLPQRPDEVERPKRTLVDLARRSRRKAIQQDMVPVEGISAVVGAGYTARLIQFIETSWSPREAAAHSDSLTRCLHALERLAVRI